MQLLKIGMIQSFPLSFIVTKKKVHRELHAHLIGKIYNFFFHPRTRSNKIFCLQLANNLVLSISLGPMFCRLGFFNPVLAYGEGRSTALAD